MCNIDYIPEYLHQGLKKAVPQFKNGELLFYRCDPEKLQYPYNNISLIDISHNLNFCKRIYSKEDVLWNVTEDDSFKKYHDKSIAILQLNLNKNEETIKKILKSSRNTKVEVILTLKHDPLECMYPHSVFEIKFNNSIVTWENYNDGLNSKKGEFNKAAKELRGDLRQILTSMIISGKINNSGINLID